MNCSEIIKKSNIDYFSNLNKDDQRKILYISTYLNNHSISSADLSQIQSDLIDMTVQAYQDKKDLNNIIGKDLDKFCLDILETINLKKTTKKALYLNFFFRNLLIYTCIVLFIFGTPLYTLMYSFVILVFLLFGYIEMYYRVRLSFKSRYQRFLTIFSSYAGIIIALLCTKTIHKLYDMVIPNIYVLFIFIVLFIGFIITALYRRGAKVT